MPIDISQSLNEAARSAAAPVQGLIRGVESGINTGLLISQERDRKRKLQAELDAQENAKKRQAMVDDLTMLKMSEVPDSTKLHIYNTRLRGYFNPNLPEDKKLPEMMQWPNDGKDVAKALQSIFSNKDLTEQQKQEAFMGVLAEKGPEWFKYFKDISPEYGGRSTARKDDTYLAALKLYGDALKAVGDERMEKDSPAFLQIEQIFLNESAKYRERYGQSGAPGAPPPPLNPPAGPEEPGMFSNLAEKATGVVGKLMPGKLGATPSAPAAPAAVEPATTVPKIKYSGESETYRWNPKDKKWWDYRDNQWKVSRKQSPAPKPIGQ